MKKIWLALAGLVLAFSASANNLPPVYVALCRFRECRFQRSIGGVLGNK